MGLIGRIFTLIFGDGRNALRETAEVFRENAEAAGERAAEQRAATTAQFRAEFAQPRNSLFDRVMDAVNRLPRPAMAFGTLGLFIAAMVDPVWFAARMQGIALVPEPLWWLLAAVVSFYFGARHQVKGQEFQRSIARTMNRVPQVMANISDLQAHPTRPGAARTAPDADLTREVVRPSRNPALDAWRGSER